MSSAKPHTYLIRMRYGRWYCDVYDLAGRVISAHGPYDSATAAERAAPTQTRNGDR